MTGCAPAELLGGGRDYFDALCERARARRQIGWDIHELLAELLEVSFASYRALLALTGSKDLPAPLAVRRPGEEQRKPERISWRELQRRMSHAGH